MTKLGPDERPGYRALDPIPGYDLWAPRYDRDPNPLIVFEEPVTLELLGGVRGRRVLDLGCGTGRYCARLAALGAEVAGVDASPQMLLGAAARRDGGCHFPLLRASLEHLPFADRCFDLALCALTFSHLEQLDVALREAARVLVPGGRLVISDIHPYWPVSGHDYTEFFDGAGQEYRIRSYAHLLEEYWRLFGQLGLQLEELRELRIDADLIQRFPSLEAYRGVPLALVLGARKGS